MPIDAEARQLLSALFDAAIRAADPATALRGHLPAPPRDRTVVVGCGKGAAQLAAAFESLWPAPVEGVVVTRYGYGAPCAHIRVMEAAHPVPDEAGLEASRALFGAVANLTADDLVVALICGGGSALLPAPPAGLTLADEQALNAALLASGAPISAMNAVRKHASAIKGGRLALAAHPARVVTLVVSDIPGDDPALVASGPTVADSADRAAALTALREWRLDLPEAVGAHLRSTAAEAPRPDDPRLAGNETRVIASAAISLEAAAQAAQRAGVTPVILTDSLEGEAREVARAVGAIAREVARCGRPFKPPVVLLSGGETTVTLRAEDGRGGRNGEFALALARDIAGVPSIAALAADTDGIDGSQDNAGAFCDDTSVARLKAMADDAGTRLADHDSWGAFERLGDLFVTGPTGTNVNDFRAVLIR